MLLFRDETAASFFVLKQRRLRQQSTLHKKGWVTAMSVVNNTSVQLLSKTMDGLWKRQETISENIANIDTPYYRRKSVSFEDQLKQAMNGSNSLEVSASLSGVTIEAQEDSRYFYTADYNGVDIDKENLELAKSTIQYQYAVRMLNDSLSRMRCVITEGRG